MSFGYSPFSTQVPMILQRILLKYSWREYERNERESVNIPTPEREFTETQEKLGALIDTLTK